MQGDTGNAVSSCVLQGFDGEAHMDDWIDEGLFWVQTQARAGNWVDSLGTSDLESAKNSRLYEEQEGGRKARVVRKQYRVVVE